MPKWTDSAADFEQTPTGNHLARCVGVVDIGTHNGEYQGRPTRNRQNVITWELVNEKMQDGRPFLISKFYTTSLGEKANLRKDLVSWRGRDFTTEELKQYDPRKLLGVACQISVIENDKGKSVVKGVAAPLKGVEIPKPSNPLTFFDLDDDFTDEDLNKLPNWLQNKIKESEEWKFIQQSTPEFSGPPQNGNGAKSAAVGRDLESEAQAVRASATDEDIPF